MKNFFLYYNKNNHILAKEIFIDDDNENYYSDSIDEPFFVIGIYLDSKKFNSTDLTPYEQSFCLSDFQNAKNIQPNYFRDSFTPLIFNSANLVLASNGGLSPTRFGFPNAVGSDSKYRVGDVISFRYYFADATIQLFDPYPYANIITNFVELDGNKFVGIIGNINFAVFNDKLTYIDILLYSDTNVVNFSSNKYQINYKVHPKGVPYIEVVDSEHSQTCLVYYSNLPIDIDAIS